MNNLHYDFENTGYKIHLPVVPDSNDSLTRRIADFLDQKFGLQTNNRSEYRTPYYKIGSGGEFEGGKGITLYGRTQSMQEMKELAQEIEEKFGKELAERVKNLGITFDDPIKLSESVSARFSVYRYGFKNPDGFGFDDAFLQYNNKNLFDNASGALPVTKFKTIRGEIIGTTANSKALLNPIDYKFWVGDSTMFAIDNFGELFTGKIENGHIPKSIIESLPKEYIQHYHLTEQAIIERIDKGSRKIVANMLEDVATNPKSAILLGNPPWFATLEPQVINEAKQLLAQNEPQVVEKLEQILPQLEKKCPSLSILRQTTPYSSIVAKPTSKILTNKAVSEMRTEWGTSKVSMPQVTTSQPLRNLSSNEVVSNLRTEWGGTSALKSTPATTTTSKATWVDDIVAKFNSKGGKIGLCVVGAVALAGVATSIFAQSDNKELLATNKPSKQTNIYGNCFTMSKGNMTV